jgi:dihydrofolate reductase
VEQTRRAGVPQKPQIGLVAAVAINGVIGAEGGLPWRLPSDLKRFKAVTMGKPVIMGRKTHQSIGRPLPGRRNIVVTRSQAFAAAGVEVAHSLDEAIAMAGNGDAAEVCVIGGGELYRQALPIADRLYITHVMAEPEGDTLFPPIHQEQWLPVSSEVIEAGENDSAQMRFVVYERTSSNIRP